MSGIRFPVELVYAKDTRRHTVATLSLATENSNKAVS